MTRIIAGTKTEFSIDPAILELLPRQGSVELQRDVSRGEDVAGKPSHPLHQFTKAIFAGVDSPNNVTHCVDQFAR